MRFRPSCIQGHFTCHGILVAVPERMTFLVLIPAVKYIAVPFGHRQSGKPVAYCTFQVIYGRASPAVKGHRAAGYAQAAYCRYGIV